MAWTKKLKTWAPAAVLIMTFFAWSWGQDWVRVEDWTRNGKILMTVAAAALGAGIYTCKRFHWTVGLFLAFVLLRWVSLRLAPACMIDVVMISACIFLAIFVHRFDDRNLLGNCLAIDAFLQASLGLSEIAGFFPFLEISPELKDVVWPPIAAHGHPTILGPYLAVSLAFVPGAFGVVKKATLRQSLQLFVAAVILACIAFTQSTMTVMTLGVVAILAVGFYFGTRAMLGAVALAGVLGAGIVKLYPSAGSFTGRLPQWGFAWENLTPLGHGPGTWFPVAFHRHMAWIRAEEAAGRSVSHTQFFGQLHNDWLQGLFEFGWIGMAPLFLGLIVATTITLKAILLRRRELFPYAAMFFGLAADAFGNFILHTMPSGGLFAIAAIYIFRFDFEEAAIREHYRDLERNL